MTIYDKIRDEKLQYDINRDIVKTSELFFGKIHKHEFLTGDEMLISDQIRMI